MQRLMGGRCVLGLALLAGGACGGDSDHHAHWGYEADDGPSVWASMDTAWAVCGEGRAQSPIDLTGAVDTTLPPVAFHIPTVREVEVLNQAGVIDALDNGHTIQINARTGERFTVGDRTFDLVQFHFHAPSEHSVDGRHYPMEMHFVYQGLDGTLAVTGVFIEEGAENPVIEPIWAQLAQAPGSQATITLPPRFEAEITPLETVGLFHYRGSLTTPPCSEAVDWYVLRTPIQLSQEQIDDFTAVYDHNNRPVQPLNGRPLYWDARPSLTLQ